MESFQVKYQDEDSEIFESVIDYKSEWLRFDTAQGFFFTATRESARLSAIPRPSTYQALSSYQSCRLSGTTRVEFRQEAPDCTMIEQTVELLSLDGTVCSY